MPGLLFDMDGVLYEGERPVAGAAGVIRWCRDQTIPHLFLTNTTSRPRQALARKLERMGIHIDAGQILTPPVAALRWLRQHARGPVALFVPEATRGEFAECEIAADDYPGPVAAVVVGDLGEGWDFATLNRAFRLLMDPAEPPLVALGMTRYWRAEDGLRLDTGPFVRALEYACGREAVVLGKPAAEFFHAGVENSAAGLPSTTASRPHAYSRARTKG
ncbi:MAG: TIGR01458 family HAD-type hydrolase, partial [Gammaproteobacteria bacterium]